MIRTLCCLDCWDCCELEFDGRVKGGCGKVNNELEKIPRIKPRIGEREVSLEEAKTAAFEALQKAKNPLLYRGSGNMGVMNRVTNLLFEKLGGTITSGSLCDGNGQAGIEQGRGEHVTLPLEQIQKSEVVVVWGRNVKNSNMHLYPHIKDKQLIVIDPVETALAKKAHIHVALKPKSDFYLAMLLARFVFIEQGEDREFLQEHTEDPEWFEEFVYTFRIKKTLEKIDMSLDRLGDILYLLQNKKTVFLVGTGVQKYHGGADTLRAIDALAAVLGLFGKEGCGVSYMGESMLGFENPFAVECKETSCVDTPFSAYDAVLIQGANPVHSMPNTTRVERELEGVETVIYFGLYENETSQKAHIVLPGLNFFEKDDFRSSYGDSRCGYVKALKTGEEGIGEYDFCAYAMERLGQTLPAQKELLERLGAQCREENGVLRPPAYEKLPYKEGFETPFEFVEEYDYKAQNSGAFFLLTPKYKKSLNSQFQRGEYLYLHPEAGFAEGARLRLFNEAGELFLTLKHDPALRRDCALVYSSTPGINRLSTHKHVENCAVYQELQINIETE